MRDGLAFAVLALVLVGAPYLFRARRSGPVRRAGAADGPLVLQPPRRNGIMLGVTALIPAGVLAAMTFHTWNVARTGLVGVLAIGVTAIALAAAAYQFAHAARACIVVHDTGIERVGVRRRRVLSWADVAKVAFNPMNHWFFVTARDGTHVWLPADVPGMDEFARIALRRLPAAALEADPVAREVLDELAATT